MLYFWQMPSIILSISKSTLWTSATVISLPFSSVFNTYFFMSSHPTLYYKRIEDQPQVFLVCTQRKGLILKGYAINIQPFRLHASFFGYLSCLPQLFLIWHLTFSLPLKWQFKRVNINLKDKLNKVFLQSSVFYEAFSDFPQY